MRDSVLRTPVPPAPVVVLSQKSPRMSSRNRWRGTCRHRMRPARRPDVDPSGLGFGFEGFGAALREEGTSSLNCFQPIAAVVMITNCTGGAYQSESWFHTRGRNRMYSRLNPDRMNAVCSPLLLRFLAPHLRLLPRLLPSHAFLAPFCSNMSLSRSPPCFLSFHAAQSAMRPRRALTAILFRSSPSLCRPSRSSALHANTAAFPGRR
jgi:hypothetical protein